MSLGPLTTYVTFSDSVGGAEERRHLLGQRSVGLAAIFFKLLDLVVDFVERFLNGCDECFDGLLAGFEIPFGFTLEFFEARLGELQEGLVIALQGVGSEGFEDSFGFLFAPAEHQPRKGESGNKTKHGQNVLHSILLSLRRGGREAGKENQSGHK